MTQEHQPPSWYNQSEGSPPSENGHRWADSTGDSPTEPPKKVWYRQKRFIIPIAFLVLVAALIPKDNDESAAPAAAGSSEPTPSVEAVIVEETVDPEEQERLESEAAEAELKAQAEREKREAEREAEEQRKAEEDARRQAEEEARQAEEEARKAALADPATYATISSRDWKLLERDPDSHAGDLYIIHGYVTQSDSNMAPAFRADTDGSKREAWYEYDINTIVLPGEGVDAQVVADDMVTLYVEVTGAFTYDTTIGGTATAVMVTAHIVDITEAVE